MIQKKYVGLLICIVITFLIKSSVGAQTVLYGADRTSNLYTINPVTGVSTLIGPMGISLVTALGVDPFTGTMYASPGGDNAPLTGCLYSVDKGTGAATQIGCDPVQGGIDASPGYSFDAGGTLYAIRVASNGGAQPQDNNIWLSTINTATGIFTDIGSIYEWPAGNGISFVGSVLYHWGSGNGLSTLSLADGTPTIIGGSFIGFPTITRRVIPSMAADPATGVLYAIVVDSSGGGLLSATYLATVNTTTGDVTYLSTLLTGMQEIAFEAATPTVTDCWYSCYEVTATDLDDLTNTHTACVQLSFCDDNTGTMISPFGDSMSLFFDSMKKQVLVYSEDPSCVGYIKFHGDDLYILKGIGYCVGEKHDIKGHQIDCGTVGCPTPG